MKIYKLYHSPTGNEFYFKKNPFKLKISKIGKIIDLESIWDKNHEIDNYKKLLIWADKNITIKEIFFDEEIEITKCNLL